MVRIGESEAKSSAWAGSRSATSGVEVGSIVGTTGGEGEGAAVGVGEGVPSPPQALDESTAEATTRDRTGAMNPLNIAALDDLRVDGLCQRGTKEFVSGAAAG